MLTEPPSPALDLVVIGGLTIDRFADGSSAAGGSVLHIARAANRRGVRLGISTAAGPEPVAAAGLDELRRLAHRVEVGAGRTTATFRHQETAGGRRLWLEGRGSAVAPLEATAGDPAAMAVLYAPVADEVGADAIHANGDQVHGAILQGWLRATADGDEVTQVSLASLDDGLRRALATLDVLVASREDLTADGIAPSDQLTALRQALGQRPVLVVTDSVDGLWLDVPESEHQTGVREHLPVPWRVEDVATVGAGDILAAFLLLRAKEPPRDWRQHASAAMQVVAEELDGRRSR